MSYPSCFNSSQSVSRRPVASSRQSRIHPSNSRCSPRLASRRRSLKKKGNQGREKSKHGVTPNTRRGILTFRRHIQAYRFGAHSRPEANSAKSSANQRRQSGGKKMIGRSEHCVKRGTCANPTIGSTSLKNTRNASFNCLKLPF